MKRIPLEIVFLNRPNPDRLYKAWAEIEFSMEQRHETSVVEQREKDKRSA